MTYAAATARGVLDTVAVARRLGLGAGRAHLACKSTFTLIELLVVIAVIAATLVAILLPTWGGPEIGAQDRASRSRRGLISGFDGEL